MKNGFTLVELLAVLVVLGVITLVSVPNIINTNKKSIENDYNEFKITVENAAEIYMETHPNEKPESGSKVITVSKLRNDGYINKNLTNPKTKVITNDEHVTVTKTSYGYTYKYQEA